MNRQPDLEFGYNNGKCVFYKVNIQDRQTDVIGKTFTMSNKFLNHVLSGDKFTTMSDNYYCYVDRKTDEVKWMYITNLIFKFLECDWRNEHSEWLCEVVSYLEVV